MSTKPLGFWLRTASALSTSAKASSITCAFSFAPAIGIARAVRNTQLNPGVLKMR